MKILIAKENYSFWIDVCENALKLNFVDLLFSKDKYNLLPWYKKLKLHISSFNDGKYTSFTSKFKEYIQLFRSALELDVAVCVDIDTLHYMLDCGDRNMAYIYYYNREKDKQVYEI